MQYFKIVLSLKCILKTFSNKKYYAHNLIIIFSGIKCTFLSRNVIQIS